MADFRKLQQFQSPPSAPQNGRSANPAPKTPASKIPATQPQNANTPQPSIWNREIEFSTPFNGKEKQQFFHLLAVLMEAGLSITESLEVVTGQLRKPKSRQIVQTLTQALNEGHALSEAAAAQ